MPWLQVDGKRALSSTTLIHIPTGLVEDPQHGNYAIAVAIGAADVGVLTMYETNGYRSAGKHYILNSEKHFECNHNVMHRRINLLQEF